MRDEYTVVITIKGAQFYLPVSNRDDAIELVGKIAESATEDSRNTNFMVSFVCEVKK